MRETSVVARFTCDRSVDCAFVRSRSPGVATSGERFFYLRFRSRHQSLHRYSEMRRLCRVVYTASLQHLGHNETQSHYWKLLYPTKLVGSSCTGPLFGSGVRGNIEARRVRWRLPPPPPSPADDRTPGSLGRNPEFFLWMPGDFDGRGRGAEKTRHVWSEVAAGVRMIVSRAGFRGPGGAHVRASRDTPPTDGGSGLGTAQCCRPPRQSLRPRESHPGVIPGYPGFWVSP